LYNVYIEHIIMTRAVPLLKDQTTRKPASADTRTPKRTPSGSAGSTRAPVQILSSTKEWLDQIIVEKNLRSYDEAIMFLIKERQQHLPSDFGVFSDIEEYRCKGED
jgi:hypothetical protein